MSTEKDREQDEMIRRNAESIRRNEEALRRQTEALEKIRDHYFPKKSAWKSVCGFFLKVVGAVTVAAGIMETAEWYWNTRLTDKMAEQSAAVAKRLFFRENDAAGAAKFLEKAVELDGDAVRYRIALAYVKGLAAIGDLFDLGRPLTDGERARVDAILSEAVFLQEVAPDEAMPHVLAAQAYGLRGENAAAVAAAERATALAPGNVQAHVTSCAIRFASGDIPAARQQLAEAERIDPAFPLVRYWRGFFALTVDKDPERAQTLADELVRDAPRFVLAYVLKGLALTSGATPDLPAARAAYAQALALAPHLTRALVLTAETYEREGNLSVARLWLDRALARDEHCMKALTARARICGWSGDWKTAVGDLTAAMALVPFRADLYRERAKARASAGDTAGAAEDLKTADALDPTAQTANPTGIQKNVQK